MAEYDFDGKDAATTGETKVQRKKRKRSAIQQYKSLAAFVDFSPRLKNSPEALQFESIPDEQIHNLVRELTCPIDEKIAESLTEKASNSFVPEFVLEEVFHRGIEDWYQSPRENHTKEQWAFARVNSFLSGGKAQELDEDILEFSLPLTEGNFHINIRRGNKHLLTTYSMTHGDATKFIDRWKNYHFARGTIATVKHLGTGRAQRLEPHHKLIDLSKEEKKKVTESFLGDAAAIAGHVVKKAVVHGLTSTHGGKGHGINHSVFHAAHVAVKRAHNIKARAAAKSASDEFRKKNAADRQARWDKAASDRDANKTQRTADKAARDAARASKEKDRNDERTKNAAQRESDKAARAADRTAREAARAAKEKAHGEHRAKTAAERDAKAQARETERQANKTERAARMKAREEERGKNATQRASDKAAREAKSQAREAARQAERDARNKEKTEKEAKRAEESKTPITIRNNRQYNFAYKGSGANNDHINDTINRLHHSTGDVKNDNFRRHAVHTMLNHNIKNGNINMTKVLHGDDDYITRTAHNVATHATAHLSGDHAQEMHGEIAKHTSNVLHNFSAHRFYRSTISDIHPINKSEHALSVPTTLMNPDSFSGKAAVSKVAAISKTSTSKVNFKPKTPVVTSGIEKPVTAKPVTAKPDVAKPPAPRKRAVPSFSSLADNLSNRSSSETKPIVAKSAAPKPSVSKPVHVLNTHGSLASVDKHNEPVSIAGQAAKQAKVSFKPKKATASFSSLADELSKRS